MSRKLWFFALATLATALLAGSPSEAQAQCSDQWVTKAHREVGRTVRGSGNSGDCNINRYGGGSWTSYADLKTRVRTAYICEDPWIGQVIFHTYRRDPRGSGRSGECNIYLYGNGSWGSYMDLAGKVRQSIDALAARQRGFDRAGNLVNPNTGQVVTRASDVRIMASNGVVAAGGGNVVAAGGGNAVAPGGGNVISLAGGSVVAAGSLN